MPRIIHIEKKEARKVFELAEDLASFRFSEQYMDLLDEYVRQRAWAGETCDEFKRKLQEIQNSVVDARVRFDKRIEDLAEYTKEMIKIDEEGF